MVNDILGAQYSVLGCLLIDSSQIGGAIQKLDDDDFTAPPCRLVWQTLKRLWTSGQTIDPVIVRDALTGFDNATQFLVQMMDITPTVSNLDIYIQTLKKQTALETLRAIGLQMQQAATLEQMAELVAKANGVNVSKKDRRRMDAEQMLRTFADDHADKAAPEYLPWAYRKLERQIYAEPGDMIIIAGRPSDGKTAFALVNAWHQAQKYRVGFYSLETGCKKVRDRSIAQLAGIDMGNIKRNTITDPEWEAYAAQSGSIANRSFQVVDASDMTAEEIYADALAQKFEIIYIDYLQLIRPTDARETNRTHAVTDISLRIHRIGRSTGITTVALAQLNRANVENGKVRRPQLSDLRESGQIEQDADAIVFVWRENVLDNDADRCVFVAKNKEGEIGEFKLALDGKHQRFVEITSRVPPKPAKSAGSDYQQITIDDPNCPF